MSVEMPLNKSTSHRRSPLRWIGISLLVILCLPVVAYGGFVLYVMYGVDGSDDGTSPAATQSQSQNAKTQSAAQNAAAIRKSGKKPAAAKPVVLTGDDKYRRDIVGKWEREDDGHREFTINADGSAQLVYQPTGYKRFALQTSKLTVKVKWTLKDGYVDFESTSGEPEFAFKVAKVSEGARKRRRIVELTKAKLTLTNDAGDRVSYWSRVK